MTVFYPNCGEFAAARVTNNLGLQKAFLLTLIYYVATFNKKASSKSSEYQMTPAVAGATLPKFLT